ncbi:MAG: hypothetical protein JRH11_27390 [Deltaproteobacteria bacterium]|nr:hypothetical protein [Deltaproteobacteria bacterium]
MTAIPLDRQALRLLPHEEVLWHGHREEVSRDRRWVLGPAVLYALSLVFVAFALLLWVEGAPGARENVSLAALLSLFATAVLAAPRYLHDPAIYVVTDRRVIWRRGGMQRSVERRFIEFGRIAWHRSVAGVGHLEVVRAVPFGPLARRQRLQFLDVRSPDVVFAAIRGVEPSTTLGHRDVPLVERLDPGEEIEWGGHPEGWNIGLRELGIAVLGVVVVGVALRYGYQVATILLGLEVRGLPVQSLTWILFFVAVAVAWVVISCVGGTLLWYGAFRSRALGSDTEYLLTDERLIIRRGRTELSVDRRRIVDVAETRGVLGLSNLFLVLDAPESRAVALSGALKRFPPPRDLVAPVLYEIREVERVRDLILARRSSIPG